MEIFALNGRIYAQRGGKHLPRERVCRCAGAMAARSRAEQIDKAREMIDALFGDDCYEKYGVARVGDKTLAGVTA